jgi:hypothetical protein
MTRASARDQLLAFNFAATIFLSAFLLFQIQPLISKFILPWFGGSPAVWTACLLFFQTVLFAGYVYAYFLDRQLPPRRQAIVHVALIVAAIALTGVLPGERWEPRGQFNPLSQILLTLAASIGLPYFVLSASGPLLQAWFARTFPDRVPYRLYALSNLGSLLALMSYPFFFERHFDLTRQANIWSAGFIVYAALCACAAWQTRSRVSPTRECESRRDSPTSPPPRSHRLLWLLWPACGSIVLMATTNHVSTDIAVTPLLWIVPLALYLITFIIAFDRPAWYRRTLIAVVTLAAIYAAAFVHKNGVGPISPKDCGTPGQIYRLFTAVNVPADPPQPSKFRISSLQLLAANFAAMFFICLTCHGELVRYRPAARHLTSFYLMIAAGGALGGIFVTLLAPRLFTTHVEWQLALFAATVFAIGRLLRAIVDSMFREGESMAPPWRLFLTAPVVFLLAAVLLLDLAVFLPHSNKGIQLRARNFFGTLAVRERAPEDPLTRSYVLQHGAITHGSQFTHESRRREPTTYFSQTSGIGRAIQYYRSARQSPGLRLGVVGLGVGTLAAYTDKGDEITFYEINPIVIDIANNRRWFTYLRDATERGARCHIVSGDGRLALRHELSSSFPLPSKDGSEKLPRYDLLALDAFSGDAVPVHLLTIEAFDVYFDRVSADVGCIAVNISNRFVDLEPVLRGVADRYNLRWLRIRNRSDRASGIYSADWIILTRNRSLIESLTSHARPAQSKAPILWTDAYSNLFDVLK